MLLLERELRCAQIRIEGLGQKAFHASESYLKAAREKRNAVTAQGAMQRERDATLALLDKAVEHLRGIPGLWSRDVTREDLPEVVASLRGLAAMRTFKGQPLPPLPATLHPAPTPGEVWRHVKRGSLYTVLHVATMQMSNTALDGSPFVVYLGSDGRVWTRAVAEFCDGRFERACPPGPPLLPASVEEP